MKTLLIDDIRDINCDVTARSFLAGIDSLRSLGPFSTLYLDHDLGEVDVNGNEAWMVVDGDLYPKNGYGIVCFLERNPDLLPQNVVLVTSNPVGRKNMQVVLDKLYGAKVDKNKPSI